MVEIYATRASFSFLKKNSTKIVDQCSLILFRLDYRRLARGRTWIGPNIAIVTPSANLGSSKVSCDSEADWQAHFIEKGLCKFSVFRCTGRVGPPYIKIRSNIGGLQYFGPTLAWIRV